MPHSFFVFLLALCFSSGAFSQTIPASRTVNWSAAGLYAPLNPSPAIVDITTAGGTGDGQTPNDAALQQAIAQLGASGGVVFFPQGSYLFLSSVNLPDSVVLRGQGSDQSVLRFDLGGAASDLVTISGGVQVAEWALAQDAFKGDTIITTAANSNVLPGDVLRFFQDDSALLASSWAYKSVGQILRVKAVNGNQLTLESPLRKDYLLGDSPRFRKMLPKRNCGVECLKIERLDATSAQTTNISFTYAVNCRVSGVESSMCNFAHVSASYSSNMHIEGSYFHDAFAYGGGGQGYGMVLQYTSGECLVENNIFRHLRHSMLLQAGANGNVLAYNYSIDPFWTSFPNNSAGDIVLHGNYPFANLFEGNIVQNLIIDASHGINGPFNTFFRNRAQLYGIVMSNNPASDQQNFAGNEVTSTNTFMGNYALAGSGHFEHGNTVQGTVTPAGTNSLPENSLFAVSPPSYLSGWPGIGVPYAYNTGTLPAQARYQNQTYTTCHSLVTGIAAAEAGNLVTVFPNPARSSFTVSVPGISAAEAVLYDARGRKCDAFTFSGSATRDVSRLKRGTYLLVVTQGEQRTTKNIYLTGE